MNMQDRYNSIFATRLRELIEQRKISITSLAEKLNISRQAVSQYTYGGGQPTVDKLKVICDFFGVSADYMLGLSDYRHIENLKVTAYDMGLTEETANFLMEEHSKGKDIMPNTVNRLVNCKSFPAFSFAFENYLDGIDLKLYQDSLGPDEVIKLVDLISDDDLKFRKFLITDIFSNMLDKMATAHKEQHVKNMQQEARYGKHKENSQ